MKKIIYIAGLNYSGSTLLAFILNAHSKIVSTGEVVGPSRSTKDELCSCGKTLRTCFFYNFLDEQIPGGLGLQSGRWKTRGLDIPPTSMQRVTMGSLRNIHLEVLRDKLVKITPILSDVENSVVRANASFVSAACKYAKVSILVDSSKNPMQIKTLSNMLDCTVYIIHLVRHPAGCCLSAKNYGTHDIKSAAIAWRRNFRTCNRQFSRFDHLPLLRVRYEDLCADAVKEMTRICDFLDVSFEPGMLNFRETQHHIYGNRMRISNTTQIIEDRSWQTLLRPQDLKIIGEATQNEARKCGYEFAEMGGART